MLFGIIIKGVNEINFRNISAFLFEFIPQLCFMSLLFGYMVAMIFIKWATNWAGRTDKAPSIITLMINIFIKKGSVSDMPLWGEKINDSYSQETFNYSVLIICILLIPIMLIPKPLIEYKQYLSQKRILEQRMNDFNREDDIHLSNINVKENEIEKTLLDFMINQGIYIIEFILGSVSNTASYLRLWALSLAHGELTTVFFEKTMHGTIAEGDYFFGLGFIQIFVGFFVMANVTFFVLICMDFMECFLHTLRLHWVEFQTKFYHADGYLFEPYSFKYLVENTQD